MNKERVGCNGCEAVSTPGEQSERQRDWPVSENESTVETIDFEVVE